MYLVAIHIPVYLDGAKTYVGTDWLQSLRLLRNSLGGRFGQVAVIAPSRPYDPDNTPLTLDRLDVHAEEIELIPSFDNRCRSREYWLRHRRQWREQLRAAVKRAQVVHAGLDDLYRPISYEGFLEGRQQRVPTVFVQDTDIALQTIQLNRHRALPTRLRASLYSRVYERCCRSAVATASISLLKGSALMNRYAEYQRNAKLFHDTSIAREDIISAPELELRLEKLSSRLANRQPLRLVYCGRLTERKGLLDSLKIIALANTAETPMELDIIGHGEQHDALRQQIHALGLSSCVRMLGRVSYGSELFSKLRCYDGLLFTPLAEDTPRMIFDGYAAGLPLIAYDIDYVVEREAEEKATWLIPQNNFSVAASRLSELYQNGRKLVELSRNAKAAAEYHTSEAWYQRRATWTIEAVQRHRHQLHGAPDLHRLACSIN